MNPSEKTNVTQTLVTVLLLVVLIALVGGYIYYGMYQARQVDDVVVETNEMPVSDDERRNEIIRQLAQDAPVMDAEEQARVVAELDQNSSGNQVSEERRQEILRALGQ